MSQMEVRQQHKSQQTQAEIAQLRLENIDRPVFCFIQSYRVLNCNCSVMSNGRAHTLTYTPFENVNKLISEMPQKRRPIWRQGRSQTYNVDSQRFVRVPLRVDEVNISISLQSTRNFARLTYVILISSLPSIDDGDRMRQMGQQLQLARSEGSNIEYSVKKLTPFERFEARRLSIITPKQDAAAKRRPSKASS